MAIALSRPNPEARARDAFLGLAATGWLAYTYAYPSLTMAHASLPACPFYVLTGYPCPFCGGTRSFAAMWQGDIGHAARLYPLGPLLFLVSFPVAVYGIWALLTRRSLTVSLGQRLERAVLTIGVVALLASWSLKVFWLGN